MDAKKIQVEVDGLVSAMVSRGLKKPEATAMIKSNAQPLIMLRWAEDGIANDRLEIQRCETIEEAVSSSWEILEAIPPKEDRDRAEFTRLLAQVIDKGNDIGIEVEMLNPLQAMMQKLSENAITYRPRPQRDPEAPYGRDPNGAPYPF